MSYYKHHVFFCCNHRNPPEVCCANHGSVELQAYARRAGIIFLSTPFSREAATFLADLGVEAFKIGSGEITERLARIDPANVTPDTMRDVFKANEAATPRKEQ